MTKAFTVAALFVVALSGCSGTQTHSAQDYQKATALGNPDGTFTTIVGPDTAIVELAEILQFPQGDSGPAHSVLMYDHPDTVDGSCLFHEEYSDIYHVVTKEPQVAQPCDGKRWARFHVGGIDAGFVAHLHHLIYNGTPVTLLEIDSHDVPSYIRVVY